jgi:hypothetical protein
VPEETRSVGEYYRNLEVSIISLLVLVRMLDLLHSSIPVRGRGIWFGTGVGILEYWRIYAKEQIERRY